MGEQCQSLSVSLDASLSGAPELALDRSRGVSLGRYELGHRGGATGSGVLEAGPGSSLSVREQFESFASGCAPRPRRLT